MSLIASLFASTALAQNAGAQIEELVVTARKVEERLSDAPVAVSAISETRIRDLGLTSIDDFARQATGISFSQAFGRSTDRPVIRGQSNVLAGISAGVESGAAYFIDGVYYQGDIQGFDPESLARVEIIKGPQSALYGRNTYAGAINYVTKDPSDVFSGSGVVTVGDHDEYRIAGSISGPLAGDRLGFRAGGRYYTYGGEYKNQLTGKTIGQEESKSAYILIKAKPVDAIQIRFRAQYQHDDDGHIAAFLQGAEANNCKPGVRSAAFKRFSPALPGVPATLTSTNTNQYFCGEVKGQPKNLRLNNEPLNLGPVLGVRDGTAFDGIESKTLLLSSIIDWDIGDTGFTLTSLSGYRDYRNWFGSDSDFSEAFTFFGPIAPPTVEPTFANTNRDDVWDFGQELRLSSPTDRDVRFMVGLYYFKLEYQSVDLTFANPRRGEPLGSPGSEANTIEDRAAFGLVGWDINDRLTVTGEIRYSEEVKQAIDRGGFCAGYDSLAATFARTTPCTTKGKWTGLDPRVTIDYTTPGGTLLYANVAQGRKPGGFNGSPGVAFGVPRYNPEKVRGGEIGTKFDALDNALRVSVAAYYNRLSDIQLSTSAPLPGSPRAITSIVTNSGDGRTQGLEVEIQAAPTEGLSLTLGYSYTDAKFTKGCDADQFILNSGGYRPNFSTLNPPAAAIPLCSIKGNRLPLAAPHTVNGSLSYERDLSAGSPLRLFSTASFSYEDKRYVQVDNLAYGGAAFLLNARVGVRADRFSVALFGRNLTDEDSVPLPSRWFDLRYGAGSAAPDSTFNGSPLFPETGNPRAFFGVLRKGRTFGVEATGRF